MRRSSLGGDNVLRRQPQSPDEQWGVHERQLLRERQRDRQHRRRARLTEEKVRTVQARNTAEQQRHRSNLAAEEARPPPH